MLGSLFLLVVLVACGGEDATPVQRRPTAVPMTPTPRSTPLPEVPTVPPLGSEGRPVTLAVVLPDGADVDEDAADDLAGWFLSETGLTVEVETVANESEALRLVCTGTPAGGPAAVWVSAFTAVAAQRDCSAVPSAAVVRGVGARATLGTPVEIVSRADVGTIGALRGQAFCHLEGDPLTNWVFPSLLLTAGGIDPFDDLEDITAFEDPETLVRALYAGDCAAAALTSDLLDDVLDELEGSLPGEDGPARREELDAAFRVLRPAGDVTLPAEGARWSGYPANVIPYETLVFPPEAMLPADLREALHTALLDYTATREGERLLRDWFDASRLLPVEPSDFDALRSVLNQARWDMAFSGP